jgi:ABC-type multidrug transport system ATPase subunit
MIEAAASPPALSLDDVEKRYRGVRVLFVPRLVLATGARVTLRGSNGSGKSTLLRLMAGISPQTKGVIWRERGKRIGYIPQAGGLSDELSLSDNLDERRRLCGLPKDPKKKQELLRRAGLGESSTKHFAELSGGLQRLAAIVSALYLEPHWILADEPFAGVDRRKREEVERLLSDHAKYAELMIVTSPESEEHFSFAPQVISLKDGHLDVP